jgi:DSBA-like thioredoxin domain
MIELEDVKARLAGNLQRAIDLGVFGVPTFIVNAQLFWGEDTLPMVLYVARSPNWLDGAEVNRISNLPSSKGI